VQIRNEFNPIIPYTWLFHFWLIFFGLILISNIISNIDKPSLLSYFKDRNRVLLLFIVGILIWICTLGLISISRNPVFYWITAAIYHAIMIPISLTYQYTDKDYIKRRKEDFNHYRTFENVKAMFQWSSIKKAITLKIFSDFFRGFLYFILIIISCYLWATANHVLGSIEDNYHFVYGIFLEPLFYCGIVVGVFFILLEVRQKIQISYIGDLIAISIVGLSLLDIYFLAPFVLGYLIVIVFLRGSNQNPINSAIHGFFMQIAWLMGLILFTFSGMLISLGIAALIKSIFLGIAGGLLGFSILLLAIRKILHRNNVSKLRDIDLKMKNTLEAT